MEKLYNWKYKKSNDNKHVLNRISAPKNESFRHCLFLGLIGDELLFVTKVKF